MPTRFYRIKGLPGFDGLIVETDDVDVVGLLEVKVLHNANVVVGDRTVKFPMPPGSLWIDHNFLVPDLDPSREYSTENPFGEYLYEGSFTKGDLYVAYTEFDNALTVTIIEKNPPGHKGIDKTLYSESFFSNKLIAMEFIRELLDGRSDPDDLIFELRNLKEQDTN